MVTMVLFKMIPVILFPTPKSTQWTVLMVKTKSDMLLIKAGENSEFTVALWIKTVLF